MDTFAQGLLYGSVGIAVLVIILILSASSSGQGATLQERILSSPRLSPFLILHYFLPYGLIILCIFMDIMSQLPQGVFGIAAGVVIMLLNWGLGRFVQQPDLLPNDLCEIPGFKNWSSKFVPQSLLFVSTVVTYLAAFVTSSQINTSVNSNLPPYITSTISSSSPSPSLRTGATWGLSVAVILIQAIGLASTPGCLSNMGLPFTGITLSPTASILGAIALGMTSGGIAGWQLGGQSFTQPSYVIRQTANVPMPPAGLLGGGTKAPGFIKESFQLGAGLGEVPIPTTEADPTQIVNASSSTAASGSNESSDQFVCEAYKNGQLVTSTLVG